MVNVKGSMVVKSNLFMLLSILMLLISSNVYSQHIERYNVTKINSEITIDGILDENAWNDAELTNKFVILGNDVDEANQAGYAKMLWDDTYLYVAFISEDTKIWGTFQNQDDPLYKEDVVEVYIDPDGDGENYIEVEVNPLNTIFDLWLTKPYSQGGKSNVPWTMEGLVTAISVNGTISNNSDVDTVWICEMAMPFSEMAFAAPSMNFPPLENEFWKFNLYRFDRTSTNNSTGEATGWSQTNGGQHEPSKFGAITFVGLATDVDQSNSANQIVDEYVLHQNYPNPFNPSTQISFSVPKATHVQVSVYNMLGQQNNVLMNQNVSAGTHHIIWDGTNELGETVTNGVYFYNVKSDFGIKTMKMMMLK